jgi:cobalt-zinc-cadmium efflux system membrane fusion protein
MIEEYSVAEDAPPASLERLPRALRRYARRAVPVALLVAAGVALTLLRRPEHAAVSAAPFSVAGDRIDLQPEGRTWGYIELMRATLADPLPPEPVPGHVAFDEARAQPIIAPLQGHVDSVAVRLGQQVQQGDRLLAVRSAALVDLLREIDLLQAEEAARTKNAERVRALVELKAVPEKDFIAAEQERRQAHLAREAAELKLHSQPVTAESNGVYWITAPRSGVVVERNVLVGHEVGPERGDPLLVIGELDEVIVTADVPESAVAALQVGQPAQIASPAVPGRELTGQIEYVGEVVDPVRRMVSVRVRVRNSERTLRPNAFVQVTFSAQGQARVVVPSDAVVTDDDQSFIFVQSPDRPYSLQRRIVQPGRQREGKVEIVGGLEPGETFVAKGAILLLNAIDLAG